MGSIGLKWKLNVLALKPGPGQKVGGGGLGEALGRLEGGRKVSNPWGAKKGGGGKKPMGEWARTPPPDTGG
mgnify:CR=1 FL=1